MKALCDKVVRGKFAPIPNVYSSELSDMINSMLRVNPKKRPAATELIDYYLVDVNKTFKRKNSDPEFLKTLKVPRDMMRLKTILPENK